MSAVGTLKWKALGSTNARELRAFGRLVERYFEGGSEGERRSFFSKRCSIDERADICVADCAAKCCNTFLIASAMLSGCSAGGGNRGNFDTFGCP